MSSYEIDPEIIQALHWCRLGRMSTGNAYRPRRIKARDQLLLGMWFARRADRQLFQLRNQHRHEKTVELVADQPGSRPFVIPRKVLERDYEAVTEA